MFGLDFSRTETASESGSEGKNEPRNSTHRFSLK